MRMSIPVSCLLIEEKAYASCRLARCSILEISWAPSTLLWIPLTLTSPPLNGCLQWLCSLRLTQTHTGVSLCVSLMVFDKVVHEL